VKDKTGKPVIKGGSTIGAWPLLPLNRFNPFKLDDHYGTTYDAIPLTPEDKDRAEKHATALVDKRVFTESIPDGVAAGADEVPEMWRYNREMFRAFSTGDYYSALLWAQKSVSNKEWRDLARQQQEMKEREIGGLVAHPWGVTSPAAEEAQRVIRRYPLLNEMGAAMWGMAVCQFRLGNKVEAKQWIRSVIEAIAYHQIFAPDGPGYWNALVSWETNPAGSALDAEMGILYREVLSEMGRTTALPQNITLAK
jgi:hypothetical protein